MNSREVYAAYEAGKMKKEELGIFAGKIQLAMKEDGVLPKEWLVI
jgi:hypothetical protein